jgi:hypothetical protein
MAREVLGTKVFSPKNVLYLKSLYDDKTFFVKMILGTFSTKQNY